MALSKHQIAEAKKIYEIYWDSYTKGDLDTFAFTLDEDFETIGTSETEVAHNKADGVKIYKAQMHEIGGKTEMRNRQISAKPLNDMVLINETCDIYLLGEPQWMFYSKIRISTLLHETNTGWKVIQQHGSLPDMRVQEGETLAFEKITKENLELRDAVKRRTIELENKTKELEIEAGLERVRSVAMGMKKPENMLDVCRIISEQLQQFGVTHIRNIQTAIIDEEKGIYLCYQYFPAYGQTTIEDTEYQKSPVENEMVRQMLASRDGQFTGSLTGKELEEFGLHRKEVDHFPDPLLDAATEISYCFLSIGEGGLGLSLYQKMEAEVLVLFRRFHQVFSLAYQRFRDIQKAEANAREAQIETALERVRSTSLAMHSSQDLSKVVYVVFTELIKLDAQLDRCLLLTVNPETLGITWFLTGKEGLLSNNGFLVENNPHPSHQAYLEGWRNKRKKWHYLLEGEEKKSCDEYLFSQTELAQLPDFIKADMAAVESIHTTISSDDFGCLIASSISPLPEAFAVIVDRFTSVFNQTYTRFLDLQKAEAQAREAQIEAALERVRSKTMAMHNSRDVGKSVATLFDELFVLGLIGVNDRCGIGIMQPDEMMEAWTAAKTSDGKAELTIGHLNMKLHPLLVSAYGGWVEKKEINQYILEGEDILLYYDAIRNQTDYKIKRDYFSEESRIVHTDFYFNEGCLYVFSKNEFSANSNPIFLRFVGVFGQTYRRYKDLQKAEAQAREAQIEAALEKVRSTSLAIHQSHELEKVVVVLFDKLKDLGVPFDSAFIYLFDKTKRNIVAWVSSKLMQVPVKVNMPYDEEIKDNPIIADLWHAIESGEHGLNKVYIEKDKDDYFRYEAKYNKSSIPESITDFQLQSESWVTSFASEKNSIVGFDSWQGHLTSNEDFQLLKRSAKVFEQAYIRFLDLQKAEAQAREAQIEAALERVRSRTMAMQHSEDLTEVAKLLFHQVQALGVPAWSCGFNIWEQKEKCFTGWMSSQGILQPPFKIPFSDSPTFNRFFESRQKEELFYVEEMGGDTLVAQYEYMRGLPGFGEILDNFLKSGFTLPTFQINHVVNFLQGNLIFITSENVPEAHDLFKRFSKVFEQTYTRFLDLQKAEAQAREAQIEAALEKVRSRSLAMQKPEELVEVAELLRGEMGRLGVEELETSSIYLVDSENKQAECWYAIKDIRDGNKSLVSDEMTLLLLDTWVGSEMWKFFQSKKEQTSIAMKGDNRKEWISYCADRSQVLQGYYGNEIPERTYHLVKFNGGYMGAASPGEISPASWDLLKRAAAVFSFAYTRFKDLQDAAARAREAQIELAMEKVRGRTMAMQSSDELADAAYVLFEQLKYLGVTHERINIGIVNEDNQTIDFWITEQGGDKLNTKFSGRISEPTTLSKAYAAWKNGEKSLRIDLQGEELKSWLSYLNNEIKIPFNKSFLHNRRVQTAGFFSKGMLILTSPEPLQQEALYLLEKFAGVFDLTYTRFSDLKLAEAQALQAEKDLVEIKIARQKAEDALAELKSTQAQLIQSEKMASLGELTAGIAHEIQNPLNFVNNFSEVNSELIDEQLEEIEKGDFEEVKELAHLLKENSSKITLHGKRADAIVKGMLEHSKRGSGQREPTDLNALADDFLRMTYQSFLAKDPNFKVEFKTNLDPDLPKISVIPQDIGKVLLNLYSNAFYACGQLGHTERSRSGMVTVATSYSPLQGGQGGRVMISVKDNGPGIPDSIKDKIFQPFFTTKPTGQGTGLGLSLSYDIVKAHGGELKVETKEGEGTTFIIILPTA